MANQGFREISANPFVYQESDSGGSSALGWNNTSQIFEIHTSATAGALPTGTPQFKIDPAAAGNITLTPNGAGNVVLASLTTIGTVLTSASGVLSSSGVGTSGQIISSGGAGVSPAWTTTTYPKTTAIGDILVATAANTITAVTGAATSGWVLTANGAGTSPTFQAASGGGIGTLDGDSGSATGATVTIAGTSNQISTVGAGSTVTISLPSSVTISNSFTMTDGSLIVGNNISGISASDVDFKKSRAGGVITSGDNLGFVTFQGYDGTNYIIGSQITSTNSGTVAANRIASDLEFYTHPDSTTSSTLRMTIASTGDITIASPDSGTALTITAGGETITAGDLTLTSGNLLLPLTTSSVGQIKINSVTYFQSPVNGSLYLAGAGNLTASGTDNFFAGTGSGAALTTSSTNIGIGFNSLNLIATTSTNNIAMGYNSLASLGFPGGTAGGSENVAIGHLSLYHQRSGSYVIGIGYGAGTNLAAAESSNIYLNHPGVASESNTLRIGAGAGSSTQQLNKAFIYGIYGITGGTTVSAVVVDSNGQVVGTGATGAAGTVLTSNGATSVPTWQTPSASLMPWNDSTTTPITLAVNNGYVSDDGANLVTFTLPATAALGGVISIVGKAAGLWKIAQNSGQTIHYQGTDTTTGTGGSLSSGHQYDCVNLVCITANTDFVVNSSSGNLVVV